MTPSTIEREAIVRWLRGEESYWKDSAYNTSLFQKLIFAIRSRKRLPHRRGIFVRFLKIALFDQKSIAACYGKAAAAISRGDHLPSEQGEG